MTLLVILFIVSVLLNAYLIYRNGTLSAIETEIAKIEAEAVTDAKAVVARIKALL
jgi:hypothetical protein